MVLRSRAQSQAFGSSSQLSVPLVLFNDPADMVDSDLHSSYHDAEGLEDMAGERWSTTTRQTLKLDLR